MNRIIICLIFILTLVSCSKKDERRCFKNRGADVEKIIELQDFTKLKLGKGIRFNLIQDTLNYLKIRTGENLLNFIEVANLNTELVINNLNSCNFLRYGNNDVVIDVHFKIVRNIIFEGSEPLRSDSTLNLDYLGLIINESSTQVDLNLNVDTLRISNPYAWPKLNLKGTCNILQCELDGDMQLDFSQFSISNEFNFASSSSQFCILNLSNTNKFVGQLTGTGDVGYFGLPLEMHVEQLLTGAFIPL